MSSSGTPHMQGGELPTYGEYLEIDEWRSHTLSQVMWVVLPFAVLTGFPYAYFATVRGPTLATLASVPSVIAVILAALLHRSFRVRALCLLMVPYWLGLTSMFMHGTLALLYLLAFIFGVVILMGPKYAYAAIVLAALTLMVGGQYTNWHPSIAGIDSDPLVTWAVITVNFVSVAMVITFACRNLLGKVEFSLKAQKIAAHSVDLRQAEISRLTAELRQYRDTCAE